MVITCTAVVNSYDLLAQFACKGQVCYTLPKWLQLSTFWILMQGSTVDLFRCSEIRTRVRRFSMSIKFFGKYRGQVIDNLDPEQIGRLLVSVPVAFLTRRDGPCLAFRSLETSRVSSRFLLAERTYGSSSSAVKWIIRYGAGVFGPRVPRCRFWR